LPTFRTTAGAVALMVVTLFVGACQTGHESAGEKRAHELPAAPPPPDAASAAAASVNQGSPPGPAPEGMVWVPGGTFWMGCADCEMPDALPVHLVTVERFRVDEAPVTNRDFERFVRETGYLTIAERPLDPKQ